MHCLIPAHWVSCPGRDAPELRAPQTPGVQPSPSLSLGPRRVNSGSLVSQRKGPLSSRSSQSKDKVHPPPRPGTESWRGREPPAPRDAPCRSSGQRGSGPGGFWSDLADDRPRYQLQRRGCWDSPQCPPISWQERLGGTRKGDPLDVQDCPHSCQGLFRLARGTGARRRWRWRWGWGLGAGWGWLCDMEQHSLSAGHGPLPLLGRWALTALSTEMAGRACWSPACLLAGDTSPRWGL